ncbi:flagellar basal body P-ring formation chaperone FlgA [Onishia taeanensis]
MRDVLSACLMGLAALTSGPAVSQDHAAQDRETVAAVKRFLLDQAPEEADDITVEVFLPSANFGTCPSPRAFFPNGRQRQWGRVSVGVECEGAQVRYMQAEIQGVGGYVTAAERIAADTVIDQGMLVIRQGNLNRLPRHTIRQADDAIGMLARRAIPAGSTLQEHQLRAIPLVERRQTVSVEAQGKGFRVSREGEALEDGGLGDEVRVRLSRREIITGRVTGNGRVAVTF